MDREIDGFVLTRDWRDEPGGLELVFWLATTEGPLRVRVTGERAVAFVERGWEAHADERRPVELRTMSGTPVDALYFRDQRRLVAERDRLARAGRLLLEGDVRPTERFLMERFVTGSCRVRGPLHQRRDFLEALDPVVRGSEHRPALRCGFLCVRTEPENGRITSIAWLADETEIEFVAGDAPAPASARRLPTERGLLEAFFAEVRRADPDVLAGWTAEELDLGGLARRCDALDLPLAIGRGGEPGRVLPPRSAGRSARPQIPGRVVLDAVSLLRTSWKLESFVLADVAHALLGRVHPEGRAEPGGIERCRLIRDVFEHAGLVRFAVERQRLSGVPMDKLGGSVAAFDHLYLPRLHRRGFVAGASDGGDADVRAPGGRVLASRPGLHDGVVVLDFKSLYPSIIRTFRIDPLGMAQPGDDAIEGFDGARFAREGHILPGLLESLWRERDLAKRADDAPQSYAIKILMNSFYGVLGSRGCRFHDRRLASSITRRGHDIIERTRARIVASGLEVLYGDTDSLFVLVASGDLRGRGDELATWLNAFWRETIAAEHRLESFLTIEIDTCYRRLLLPTLRDSTEGSAKRYAGVTTEGRLMIKGFETVRSDRSALSRRFQRELLRRVLDGEEFVEYLRDTKSRLLRGEFDSELGDEDRAPPRDRRLHVDRQLARPADSVLGCLGKSFEELAGEQSRLFP